MLTTIKRSNWVRAGAVIGVISLAACSSTAQDSAGAADPTETVTSATEPAPPPGSPSEPARPTIAPEVRSITVNAVGTAAGVPDSVSLTIGVETFAAMTREVLASMSEQSDALSTYLLSQGIPAEDLQTTQLSTYPMYGGGDVFGQPQITGYQASVMLTVRIGDLDQASTVVDGAAGLVGDSLRIYGLSWSIRDAEELQAEARRNAVDKARAQARQLAEATGLVLGEITSVVEGSNTAYPYYLGGEGDGGAIPFAAGTGSVQVGVEVRFAATAS